MSEFCSLLLSNSYSWQYGFDKGKVPRERLVERMSNPLKSEVCAALGQAIEDCIKGSGKDCAKAAAVARKVFPGENEETSEDLVGLAVKAGWAGPYKLAQGKGIVAEDYTGKVLSPEDRVKQIKALEKKLAKLQG